MDHNDLLFWTYILADHAMFQANAFSYKERTHIETAEAFHHIFTTYNQAISAKQSIDLTALENDTARFINFKKEIITGLLSHNLRIGFSPTFINHMVNEGAEFLHILQAACPAKTQDPAQYIKKWLADAYGHAFTLAASIDLAETSTIHQAKGFATSFNRLYKKAGEIQTLSKNLGATPDLALLKEETATMVEAFTQFCFTAGGLLDSKQLMSTGTLSSEMTNHFINEHTYFLHKMRGIVQ